jgi:hypothetical protein
LLNIPTNLRLCSACKRNLRAIITRLTFEN